MSGLADFLKNDDDSQLLRSMLKRISALEVATQNDVPVATIVEFDPARSAQFSESRSKSVGSNFKRWYQLNDINNSLMVEDVSRTDSLRGTLLGSTKPSLGEIGGLTSEGGYSIYFPGAGSGVDCSRVDAPLAIATARNWSMEMIFRPEVIPQFGAVAVNGDGTANGFGAYVTDGAGASGSHLAFRSTAVQWIDTGVVLTAGQWYHAIFVADDSDNKLYWYVSTISKPSMIFTYTSGSAVMTAPVVPTSRLSIGANRQSGTAAFKGWIDEILLHDSEIPGGSSKLSAQDRGRAALEPSAPAGWLVCDETAVSREKYSRLFKKTGIINGAGNGTTTFNLPNIPGAIVRA